MRHALEVKCVILLIRSHAWQILESARANNLITEANGRTEGLEVSASQHGENERHTTDLRLLDHSFGTTR